jgi:hypothetical protein
MMRQRRQGGQETPDCPEITHNLSHQVDGGIDVRGYGVHMDQRRSRQPFLVIELYRIIAHGQDQVRFMDGLGHHIA